MLFICTGLIKQDSFTALLIQNALQCFHRELLHQNDALLVIKGVTVFCFVSFAVNAQMLAQFLTRFLRNSMHCQRICNVFHEVSTHDFDQSQNLKTSVIVIEATPWKL